ncbi:hypothetical protein FT663_02140 [Candidozyma haemuli var. vulneris]|uniref:DNA repair metallo-beta-lactamase domain-containing protein n=1 Tax=Candidozyma haemuli TaxID=45357 RepID=A0A2V1AMU7_9ASCO|nr:hypothetical protein CXQ85_001167 [[Candida] haemuloni]KAF3990399.1 hypothetical protein FT662_02293 [[Candida] haemuloni var. vulneris]KAF3992831.1 hypothetical protein FT663_02140 [[Candida] haemuloni var. vulneris]PVH18876.1 hypothetical protein CXQ85_001167 [[Candida] haemuloni]
MGRKQKQSSILEFSFQQERIQSHIDLTHEDPEPFPELEVASEPIPCPVCAISMEPWDMDFRIKHVEECLTLGSVGEDVFVKTERVEFGPSEEVKVELTRSQNGSVKVENGVKSESQPALSRTPSQTKKRKASLSAVQKDRLRYVNSKEEAPKRQRSRMDIDESPTELLPSSRKTPIPELKILTFYPQQDEKYQISVDAFNFKPHESITQYFLSHFHSDHYGGITKRWPRERTLGSKIIYCSTITGKLLTIRFNIDPAFIYLMEPDVRYKVYSYENSEEEAQPSDSKSPGIYATPIDANHCPGAVIFLFESVSLSGESTYMLHCGDFRVCPKMVSHPALRPFHIEQENPLKLDKVYLDTTYMSAKYNFPKQELICSSVGSMFSDLVANDKLFAEWFGTYSQSRITDFLFKGAQKKKKKFLILVGTYVIGKEKLAIEISRQLDKCPIYISNINSRGDKKSIIATYGDTFLDEVITDDDLGTHPSAIIHLVPMKIVGQAQEMANYFNHNEYFKHFERCVGLRPTGWTFDSNVTDENFVDAEDEVPMVEAQGQSLVSTASVLSSVPAYSYKQDVLRQNPPDKIINKYKKIDSSTCKIYTLPYSEHSSFRELSFFVVFFDIGEVIPTVNAENEWTLKRMQRIIRQWEKIRDLKRSDKPVYELPPGMVAAAKRLSLSQL